MDNQYSQWPEKQIWRLSCGKEKIDQSFSMLLKENMFDDYMHMFVVSNDGCDDE